MIERSFMRERGFIRQFRSLPKLALMLGVLTLSSPIAHAGNIVLYNTGVGVTGTLLGTGAVDPHYTLTANPAAGGTSSAYVATNPNPAWTGNTSTSEWINPVVTGGSSPPAVVNGEYDYATTFNLTGFIANTANITGSFTADDAVSDILINGHSTGQGAVGFSSFTNFTIGSAYSAYFLPTTNTITFKVQNTGNGPSALQVKIAGTASVVPEPSAMVPFVIGALGLMTLAAYRRRLVQ